MPRHLRNRAVIPTLSLARQAPTQQDPKQGSSEHIASAATTSDEAGDIKWTKRTPRSKPVMSTKKEDGSTRGKNSRARWTLGEDK